MRTRPIPTLAAAGLLAALALPGAATADAAGNASTRATLAVSKEPQQKVLNFPGDDDWFRVKLAKDADYYLTANCECAFDVRDYSGKVLASGAADSQYLIQRGVEFRAPYEGLFFVEVVSRPGDDAETTTYPLPYLVTLAGDCASVLPTRCLLTLGQGREGVLSDENDDDSFLVQLSAGAAYVVTIAGINLPASNSPFYVDVRPPGGGAYLVEASSEGGGVPFTASAAGLYKLTVYAQEDHGGFPYRLTLAPASETARRALTSRPGSSASRPSS